MNPLKSSRGDFYKKVKAKVSLHGHRLGLWWEYADLAELREGYVYYIKYQSDYPDPRVGDTISLDKKGVRIRVLNLLGTNRSSDTALFRRSCQGVLWCQFEAL